MIKLLGKNNDLYTENGEITSAGYLVMLISTVFGMCCFLAGRSLYGKYLQNRQQGKGASK